MSHRPAVQHPRLPALAATLLALTFGSSLAAQTAPPPAAPPPPPPGASTDLTRAQFISAMDAEFRKRDADGDGKVTRAELEAWERAQALATAQAQNRALFQKLDTNRDGVLSPGEFAALVQSPANIDVSPLMNRFDQNRDQVVTLIEWRAGTLANFDKLDTDHDGVVTAAEAAAANKPAIPPTPGTKGR